MAKLTDVLVHAVTVLFPLIGEPPPPPTVAEGANPATVIVDPTGNCTRGCAVNTIVAVPPPTEIEVVFN